MRLGPVLVRIPQELNLPEVADTFSVVPVNVSSDSINELLNGGGWSVAGIEQPILKPPEQAFIDCIVGPVALAWHQTHLFCIRDS